MDDNIELNDSGLLKSATSSTGADPSNDDNMPTDSVLLAGADPLNDDVSLNDADQSNGNNTPKDAALLAGADPSKDNASLSDAKQSNGVNTPKDATSLNDDESSVYSDYPKTLKEAIERYEKNKGKDCFPGIAPALLNSADIKAYIKNTGMIFPFHSVDLQSASYKVRIAGKVVYWRYSDGDDNQKKRKNGKKKGKEKYQEVVVRREYRDKGKKQKNEIEKIETELLKDGDYFYLQPNSIAFVTLEPNFHIPKYLALRFNLRIKHVYKGLLLGTGPIVDPGFEGRLSIPLHNLTNNTYRFDYGDDLITMEFTKLSPNSAWLPYDYKTGSTEKFKYEEFKGERRNRDVNAYLKAALDGEKARSQYVISSIPDAIYDSKEQARQARKDAKAIKKRSDLVSVSCLIGALALVISCLQMTTSTINKAIDRYDALIEKHQQYIAEIDSLKHSNEENLEKIKELNNIIHELTEQINDLKEDQSSKDESEAN